MKNTEKTEKKIIEKKQEHMLFRWEFLRSITVFIKREE